MRLKIIAIKTISIECGPSVFGEHSATDHGQQALKYRAAIELKFGVSPRILMYSRPYGTQHFNSFVGPTSGSSINFPTESVNDLVRFILNTNESGLPCALALNGVQGKRQPALDASEKQYLRLLNDSGQNNDVANSVIITDHHLLAQIKVMQLLFCKIRIHSVHAA